MKKLLISLAVLFVIIFSGVLIAPYFIPYDKISATLEEKIENAIGLDIEIASAPSASIFPQPTVEVKDIRILNPKGFSSDSFVSLGALKASLQWSELLKGTIQISGVQFIDPQFNLEINDKGQSNWALLQDMSNNNTTSSKAPSANDKKDKQGKINSAVTDRLSFDEIQVDGLGISYTTPQTQHKIDDVSITLSFSHIYGPYRINIRNRYNKHDIQTLLNVGKYEKDSVIPVQANINIDDGDATIEWVGDFKHNETITVNGQVKANAKKKWIGEIPALSAQGEVIYDGTQLKMNPLSVTFNDSSQSVLDNYITYDQENGLKLGLRAVNFDASKVLEMTPTKKEVAQDTSKNKDQDDQKETTSQPPVKNNNPFIKTHQTLQSLSKTTHSLPDSEIAIQIGQLGINKTLQFNDLNGILLVNNGELSIKDTSFKVNKAATITVSGEIKDGQSAINVGASSKELFLLTKSMGLDIDESALPKTLSLQSAINSTTEQTAVKTTDIQFDDNIINTVDLKVTPKDRIPLSIHIEHAGRLNLLNTSMTGASQNTKRTVSTNTASSGKTVSDSHTLSLPEAKLSATIGELITPQDITLKNIEFKAEHKNSVLNNIELSATLPNYKTTLSLKGQSGVFHDNFKGLNIISNFTMEQLFNSPVKDIKGSLSLKGSLDNLETSARAENKELDFEWIGKINDIATDKRDISGTYSLKLKQPQPVLKAFNISSLYTEQPINLDGKLLLTDTMIEIKQSRLKQPDLIDLTFSLTKALKESAMLDLSLNGELLKLKSKDKNNTASSTQKTMVKTDSKGNAVIIEPDPLDLSILNALKTKLSANLKQFHYGNLAFKAVEADINADDGNLKINTLSANAYGGRINVDGKIEAGQDNQAHEADVEFSIRDIDLKSFGKDMKLSALEGGTFSLNQTLETQGLTVEQLIDNSNGQGEVTIKDPVFSGIDLDKLAQNLDRPNSPDDFIKLLKGLTSKGTTAFKDINMPVNLQYGTLSLQNILAPTKSESAILTGQAIASLSEKVAQIDVEMIFPDQRNLPPLGMKISGPFSNMKKSINTDNIARFFAQRATREIGRKLFGLDDQQSNTPANDNNSGQQPTTPLEDATKQIFDKLF